MDNALPKTSLSVKVPPPSVEITSPKGVSASPAPVSSGLPRSPSPTPGMAGRSGMFSPGPPGTPGVPPTTPGTRGSILTPSMAGKSDMAVLRFMKRLDEHRDLVNRLRSGMVVESTVAEELESMDILKKRAMVNSLALVLSNAKALQKQQDAIIQMAAAMSGTRDLISMASLFASRCAALLNADFARVFVLDREEGKLRCVADCKADLNNSATFIMPSKAHANVPQVPLRPEDRLPDMPMSIAGYVVTAGRHHLTVDAAKDPRYVQLVDGPARSLLTTLLPLKPSHNDKEIYKPMAGQKVADQLEGVIGVLQLRRGKTIGFNKNEEAFVKMITSVVGPAMAARTFSLERRMQLQGEVDKVKRKLEVAHEGLLGALDHRSLMRRVTDIAPQMIRCDAAILYLMDETTGELYCAPCVATGSVGERFSLSTSIAGQAALQKHVISMSTAKGNLHLMLADSARQHRIGMKMAGILAIPILVPDGTRRNTSLPGGTQPDAGGLATATSNSNSDSPGPALSDVLGVLMLARYQPMHIEDDLDPASIAAAVTARLTTPTVSSAARAASPTAAGAAASNSAAAAAAVLAVPTPDAAIATFTRRVTIGNPNAVELPQPATFSPADISTGKLLVMIVQQALMSALTCKHVLEEVHDVNTRKDRLETLLTTASLANSSLTPHLVFENILLAAKSIAKAEFARVFLVDDEKQRVFSYGQMEGPPGPVGAWREKYATRLEPSSIVGECASLGVVMNVRDTTDHHRFNPAVDASPSGVTRATLCVPVFEPLSSNWRHSIHSEVLCVIQLINKLNTMPLYFSEDDEASIRAFSELAYYAIKNSANYLKHCRSQLGQITPELADWQLLFQRKDVATSKMGI
eukprot:jgi/Mesvir1/12175/Mv00418-RA.1